MDFCTVFAYMAAWYGGIDEPWLHLGFFCINVWIDGNQEREGGKSVAVQSSFLSSQSVSSFEAACGMARWALLPSPSALFASQL